MTSRLDPHSLSDWCKIPVEDLEKHPDTKVKVKIVDSPDDVHRWVARDMADEVKQNNLNGRPTRWILPCGPTKQYPYFAQIVNSEKISLNNVHVFHMDDCLDWQGRPVPPEHPYSYEGWMRRNFYAPIDPQLAIPEEQRHFPNVFAIDEISAAIQAVGGIDTTYGGVGFRGHIAFNEAPRSPWYSVTEEAFRNSKTRILALNEDTLISVSQRSAGGCTYVVPPMAVTLGMKDLLSAKRIRIFSDTGAWKQTVIRVLLFGPVTVEFPVTFIQEHPDSMLIADQLSAKAPLGK